MPIQLTRFMAPIMYAQDDAGNVWYMGEEVTNYEYDEEGSLIGTDSGGAWEAGVDDAEAGIVMWVSPIVGESYRQVQSLVR